MPNVGYPRLPPENTINGGVAAVPAGVGVADGSSGAEVAVGSTRLPTLVVAAICVTMVIGVGFVKADESAVCVMEIIFVVPPDFVATGNGATDETVGEAMGLFDFDRVQADRLNNSINAKTRIATFFIIINSSQRTCTAKCKNLIQVPSRLFVQPSNRLKNDHLAQENRCKDYTRPGTNSYK